MVCDVAKDGFQVTGAAEVKDSEFGVLSLCRNALGEVGAMDVAETEVHQRRRSICGDMESAKS